MLVTIFCRKTFHSVVCLTQNYLKISITKYREVSNHHLLCIRVQRGLNYQKVRFLGDVKFASSQNQLQLLNKLGIGTHYLTQYPELLTCKPDELTTHVKLMRDINLEEDAVVEMVASNPALLWKCYKICKSDLNKSPHHRIQFLSRELKVSQKTLCSRLPKYKFLLSVSLTRVEKIVKVLLEHKVEPADILSDFWILRCRAETVASRLDRVKNAEVENIRPWMGRCKNTVFEGFLNRAFRKQKLLGELSLEEYISQRLGCSATEIKEIIDREPQLQKTSVLKIKKILDFLFSSGFSSTSILLGLPRVANRKIETIHSRLQEMQQAGITPSLYVVSKSKREYQYFINKRKRGVKNSESNCT